jgi:hypothetical protein
MAFFRQYIAPLLAVLVFALALFVVSARIFLPEDMAAPAPVAALIAPSASPAAATPDAVAELPPSLAALVKGLPDELGLSEQL